MEDENNGTQESEISNNEYLPDFTRLQTYNYELFFIKENTSKIGNSLCVRLVNTNQWVLIQKALAAWINMKFVKIISKVYFYSFLKFFYPVIYW